MLFEADDYKNLIRNFLHENRPQRGLQARLARAAGCQPSFLSQALNSHVQLTLDHAAGLAQFWNLEPEEEEFFYTLCEHSRASTPRLKSFYEKKIKKMRKNQNLLSARLKQEDISESQKHHIYYSAWHYSALHVLVSIPHYQNVGNICERFPELSPLRVKQTLETLAKIGLVKFSNNKWRVTKSHIHLASDSPMIAVHHSHWRQRAITNSVKAQENDLHYSVVQAMSRSDAHKLKALVVECIEKNKKLVAPSQEEEMYCFNLDLFVV